jgi:dihydrofolate reductase
MTIHNQSTSSRRPRMAPAPSRRKEEFKTDTAPTTRNVVLAVAVSLDGYIARPGGSVDWLVDDKTVDLSAYGKQFDVIVAGRKTLDVEHASGGGGPFGKMSCYIFSRTRPPGKRGGAEYVNRSPSEFVRDLKALPGKDIWLMGGGELAREFLKENLVDRMDLGIMPVLLGEGIPLFPPGFTQRNFNLVSHQAHPSGIIRAIYARATAPE